jgi:uncharacterized SAM-binding protein YcdF (DUF218 family)
MAKHFVEAIINPYFVCLCLLLVTLVMVWIGYDRKSIKLLLSCAVIGLLIISTPFLPRWLMHSVEKRYAIIGNPDNDIRWIVVLSGGRADVNSYPENAQLYSATIKRMVEGIRLYRQLPHAKLLLSGGGYTPNLTEAEGLKLLARWFGIPLADIIIEKQSKTTKEQANNIKKMIGDVPFYLVTSAYHMPRAMFLFEYIGARPIAAPTDFFLYWDDERFVKKIMPSGQNIVATSVLLHELLGILGQHLMNSFEKA